MASRCVTCFAMLMLSLACAGITGVQAQEPNRESAGVTGLAPGDIIRLGFSREVEMGGDFAVDGTGSAVLPLLGTRRVVGVSPDALRLLIRSDYSEQLRNQEVQVLFLHRVSVLGAVTNPGLYHVDATMSLGDALALAGGPRADGRPDELRIRRNDTDVVTNLQLSMAVGERVRSGDQIFVPQKSWLSRNSGTVVGGLLSATAIILSRVWF